MINNQGQEIQPDFFPSKKRVKLIVKQSKLTPKGQVYVYKSILRFIKEHLKEMQLSINKINNDLIELNSNIENSLKESEEND